MLNRFACKDNHSRYPEKCHILIVFSYHFCKAHLKVDHYLITFLKCFRVARSIHWPAQNVFTTSFQLLVVPTGNQLAIP